MPRTIKISICLHLSVEVEIMYCTILPNQSYLEFVLVAEVPKLFDVCLLVLKENVESKFN